MNVFEVFSCYIRYYVTAWKHRVEELNELLKHDFGIFMTEHWKQNILCASYLFIIMLLHKVPTCLCSSNQEALLIVVATYLSRAQLFKYRDCSILPTHEISKCLYSNKHRLSNTWIHFDEPFLSQFTAMQSCNSAESAVFHRVFLNVLYDMYDVISCSLNKLHVSMS